MTIGEETEMGAPVIVPDASVILKWAFPSPDEEDRDKAMNILFAWLSRKIEIILPKLWVFEVGNILGLKYSQSAQEIIEIFIGYGFTEQETTSALCRETLDLMKKYHVTFYDAVYHAVAILNKGTLITTDKAYYRKGARVGYAVMLGDISF